MKSISKKTDFTFIPSQPEVESKTDDYEEYKPIEKKSRENIAFFYQFKTKKEAMDSFCTIPDGCFDIIFQCSPKQPKAFLWTSPEKRSEQLDFMVDCEYFGIRFLPEQKALKLDYPMKQLLDNRIPLNEVMDISPFLTEEICEAMTFGNRVKQFEGYLENKTYQHKNQNIINHSIKRIYQSRGQISVGELQKETGYSDRHLRNMFEEDIGFSPKKFSEIVRFQNTLRVICRDETYNLQDLVEDNGYHDLSHFLKGFKKFVNQTPHKFKESLC